MLCEGGDCKRLLDHIVQINPNLVNMSLESYNVPPDMASRLFSKLERLYIRGRELMPLETILLSAPKLHRLVYIPGNLNSGAQNYVSPLPRLVEAVAKKQISPDLDLIQLGFERGKHADYLEEWIQELHSCQGHRFTEQDCQKFIMPVYEFDSKRTFFSLMIDVRAIATHSHVH